jgi:hypothetical protein
MPNLRIIYDNAADRAALTASTTAGALVAANLQTDNKGAIWRSTSTAARLTATWVNPELLSGVALPFCNLSSTSTVRARVSNEAPATNLVLYSEQFDNAAWVKTASYFVTSGAGLAPDGSNNAELIGPTSGTNAFISGVPTQTITKSATATTYTLSVFAKAVGIATSVRISPYSAAGANSSSVVVDLTPATSGGTGSVIAAAGSSGTFTGASSASAQWIASCGMWRVNLTFTTGTDTSLSFRFFPYAGAAAITGDGSSGLLLWGAMLNTGALSSYYPATAAPAIRPAGYIDSWQSYDYDSGNVLACAYAPLGMWDWGAPLGVNAFTRGGGTYGRLWFPQLLAKQIVIDLADPDNPAGYIEAARLVVGAAWSPTFNADYGASVTPEDASQNYRTDGGTLLTEAGARYRKLSIQLSHMRPQDRANFWRIVRGNGKARPLFFSLFPESADPELEQAHQVYGKLSSMPSISTPFFNTYAAPCEIEEI